jgi:hypothetical protein
MAEESHHNNSSSSSTLASNGTTTSSSSTSDSSALSSAGTVHHQPQPPQQTTSDPVLHRLKELEESNVQNAKALERMKKDLAEREEKIKLLSADKRKEMESVLATAIDNWLNSLSGVSEENRSNFRQGISKLAEHADMSNAAWEIVCNASALHNTNVKRIEELLTEAKDRERELGELKGFRSEASRISAVKRPRTDAPTTPATTTATHASASLDDHHHHHAEPSSGPGSAWDMFQGMISRDFRSSYF